MAELNDKISQLAQVLNLKGHWAGLNEKKYIHTCCDIEGHIGTDNNYYLVVRPSPSIFRIVYLGDLIGFYII